MKTKRMRMLGTIGLMVLLVVVAGLQMGCYEYGLDGSRVFAPSEGAIGTLLGAAAGGIIGHQSGEAEAGAFTGALLGKTLGDEMYRGRKQAEETYRAQMQQQIDRANATAIQQQLDLANTRTVRIYSVDGTFTEVLIRRHPSGWITARGEIFPTLPTPQQLQAHGYGPVVAQNQAAPQYYRLERPSEDEAAYVGESQEILLEGAE